MMIFKSSEIRWISHDYDLLRNFFDALPENGGETQENVRTDYYLKSDTENTGIRNYCGSLDTNRNSYSMTGRC